MAHARKDTYVAPKEWAKHLRPDGKRVQAKCERKVAKKKLRTNMLDGSWGVH
jgi:hypothetical protein